MRNLNGLCGWDFLRLVAHSHLFADYVDFALFRHVHDKPRMVCAPPQFIEIPEGASINPTFSLATLEAQELMDALWNCGLRPTQGKGSAGQLEATERHLADMRAFAFQVLDINKP